MQRFTRVASHFSHLFVSQTETLLQVLGEVSLQCESDLTLGTPERLLTLGSRAAFTPVSGTQNISFTQRPNRTTKAVPLVVVVVWFYKTSCFASLKVRTRLTKQWQCVERGHTGYGIFPVEMRRQNASVCNSQTYLRMETQSDPNDIWHACFRL